MTEPASPLTSSSQLYLEGVSAGGFIQGNGPLQFPFVQLPHVDVVQLLQAWRHHESVVCNTPTEDPDHLHTAAVKMWTSQ